MADLIQPDVSVFRTISGPLLAPQTPADWQEQATRAQTAQAIAQEQRARAQAAAEDRATKARKAAEEQADAQLLQQLAQKHKGDPDLMLTELRAVNPRVAMKFDADWTDVKKKNIDLVTADNKNQRDRLGKHMGLLKLLEQRPDLYPVVKATIDTEDPSMSPYLPAEYDPAKIAPLFQMAHTAESILETDKLALQYLVEGKWHQAAAMAFADPTMNADEVKQKAAELIQMRVPRQVVDSFGWQQWTPDFAARALERGRTPEQRAKGDTEGALVQVAGPNGEAVWATREEARGKPVGRGPASEGALVQVVGPGGVVTWQTREQAEGKRAPRPESGSGGESAPTPTARLNATMTMQTRYNTQTKAAQTSATAVSQMRESLKAVKNGSMAAGSQGVLVTFQKLLDPTSVVRESEYDRSSAGQALMAQLQGQYDRIVSGGAGIPVSELEKFVSLAEAYNRNAQLSASRTKQQFDAMAKDFGLNPEHITRDFDEASSPGPETTKGGPSGTKRRDIKGGGVAELRNGKWIRVQ